MAYGGLSGDSPRLPDTKDKFPPGIVVAAAIDLGTTLSGYAFAFRDNPTRIYASTWSSQTTDTIQSNKTPTTVLLDRNARFHAFGFDAEEKYSALCEEDQQQDWYFFQNFKMELYRQEKLSRTTKLKDISNKEMPALNIFTMVIKFLKDKLFQEASISKSDLAEHEFMWVITVPAIWSDAAKQFMELAATQAGIDKIQLKLVLEPEAASLYCQANYTRRDLQAGGIAELSHFPVGHKYIVADLGGGTADIATHEVLPDGSLREIYRASGDELGGNRVNQAFLVFLEGFLEEALDSFKAIARHDYLQLCRDFEIKKRIVSADKPTPITIRIPNPLIDCIQAVHSNITLQQLIEKQDYHNLLQVRKDKLTIKSNLAKVFFNEPVEEIIKKLKEIIEGQAFNIDSLLLVGGFADSPFVRERITSEIQRDCRGIEISRPEEAWMHVLKGGVLSILRPNHISERLSRYSYGFRVSVPFNDQEHPQELKERRLSGKAYCSDIFHKCITIGQRLKCGEKLRVDFLGEKQHEASKHEICCTELYRSTKADPKYCTPEEGCKRVGKMVHRPPPGGWGNIAMFTAEVTIGEAELKISVINATTQEEYITTVDFLDN